MSEKNWVIIPAAGVGRRMTGETLKQYLPLANSTVIEWALTPFLKRHDIAGITVGISRDDDRFATLTRDARVRTCIGGAERSDTVLSALASLSAADNDWVLVHDAARPCLHEEDLTKLIETLRNDEVGGLLAAPVTDTLKAGDGSTEARVSSTVSRERLWRALTPQMFRFGVLNRALKANSRCTDESMAVENLGLRPKLVVGRGDNVKITVAEDLHYAEFIIRQRMR